MHSYLIVGAGVSGVSLFRQLVKRIIHEDKKNISIALAGESSSYGTGSPYLTTQPDILRINDYPDNLSLDPENNLEFLEWAFENQDLTQQHKFIVQREGDHYICNDDYPPRVLYGHYFKWVLESTKQKAEENGVKITFIQDDAISVDEINSGKESYWKVTFSNEQSAKSKILILSTGALPSDAFDQYKSLTNFHPAFSESIQRIEKEKTVAILGSRLSAYDSIRLLILSNHHAGKIHLFSPTGLISNVKNYRIKTDLKIKYLTEEAIKSYKEKLTTSDVVNLFNKEVSNFIGKNFNLSDYIEKEASMNMGKRLELGIEHHNQKKVLIRISPILHHLYFSIFPLLSKILPENEFVSLIKKYNGIFLRHTYTIPLMTAKLMHDLYTSGRLHFHKLKSICLSQETFIIESENEGEIYADYVIDATGAGKKIVSSPLLKNMLEKKLISQHTYSGLRVNPDNLKVIDFEGSERANLFALGVVTYGSCFSVYSIVGCVKQSIQLSRTLLESSSSLFNEENPTENYPHRFFKMTTEDTSFKPMEHATQAEATRQNTATDKQAHERIMKNDASFDTNEEPENACNLTFCSIS